MLDIMGELKKIEFFSKIILWISEPISAFFTFLGNISPYLVLGILVIWWFFRNKR